VLLTYRTNTPRAECARTNAEKSFSKTMQKPAKTTIFVKFFDKNHTFTATPVDRGCALENTAQILLGWHHHFHYFCSGFVFFSWRLVRAQKLEWE